MSSKPQTRGDATREALIRSALEVFGRDGFEAASTRAIASAAGVNQALIGFHFGSKKGLYLATFEHVVNQVVARMGPLLQAVAVQLAAGKGESSRAAVRMRRYFPLVCRITDGLITMFTSEEARSWALLILREQQEPGEAFEAAYERSVGRVLSVLTELTARIQNRSITDRQARLTALTLVGQALIFRAAPASAYRHLRRSRLGAADVAAIQALIRSNNAAILKAGVAT